MQQNVLDKISRYFSHKREVAYLKGTIITFAGEEPKGISFLVDGVVEQYDTTPEGNKITVNIFKPPAFFPMSWAINRTTNEYFFAALTDVTLKWADPDETVEFLHKNPDVVFDLLSRVYKGTDALLKRMVVAASGIAANRLIFELIIEGHRFGTQLPDGRTIVKIKQNTLASRSGLARETVNRELHKLEAEDVLALTKEGIVIDISKLGERLHTDI